MDDKKLEKLIRRYVEATARLIEADRELNSLRNDHYVTWDWVCWYLDVDAGNAFRMLAEEFAHVFGESIVRFRKEDIVQFGERHKIKVKDLRFDFVSRKPPRIKKGAEDDSVPTPTKSTNIIDKQAEKDRFWARHTATRDKAIERERAKQAGLVATSKTVKPKKGKS